MEELVLLRKELLGALVGLTRAIGGEPPPAGAAPVVLEGLLASAPWSSVPAGRLHALIDAAHREKDLLVPDCKWCASPCGRTADYDLAGLWGSPQEIRDTKLLLLAGARETAALVPAAQAAGADTDGAVNYLYRAVFALGEDWDADFLLTVARESGKWIALLQPHAGEKAD